MDRELLSRSRGGDDSGKGEREYKKAIRQHAVEMELLEQHNKGLLDQVQRLEQTHVEARDDLASKDYLIAALQDEVFALRQASSTVEEEVRARRQSEARTQDLVLALEQEAQVSVALSAEISEVNETWNVERAALEEQLQRERDRVATLEASIRSMEKEHEAQMMYTRGSRRAKGDLDHLWQQIDETNRASKDLLRGNKTG